MLQPLSFDPDAWLVMEMWTLQLPGKIAELEHMPTTNALSFR
jgi:hypothetical protein